ncbi:MAG: acetyltransferase [Synergistaceae bacterium]|jgi:sugar O-acyltransferase (sialic acid O-acetyltransferase NeuD family)|nr:acetyltransferase [Synergistaceae bacterium]
MKYSKVIIYGAGGLGREILQMVRVTLGKEADILGYADDGVEPGTVRSGGIVLGGREFLDSMNEPFALVFGVSDPSAKRRLYAGLKANPLISFPNVIHPKASVSEYASLGEGVVMAENSLASVDSVIGNCVFVNYGSMIGHDTVIGDWTSIMPMAAVSGSVRIGEASLIGAGSAVIQGVTVGNGSTVGIGSVVIKDVPDGATVFGSPAVRVS